MELSGARQLAAPRERVWEALNDPEVLARCIEGAESLERTAADRLEGRVAARVGPVRASFAGVVTLANLDPPRSYRLSGEGKGGAAGFARGEADVVLEEADGGTELRWTARATVGGKLAQLGARLIEGTARQMADRFFDRLAAEVETDTGAALARAEAAEMMEVPPALSPAPAIPPEPARGLPTWAWAGALALLVLAFLLMLLRG